MKKDKFLNKVIEKTDAMLTDHKKLRVTDWVLYEDFPYVNVVDNRKNNNGREFSVNIESHFENKDVKAAAKEVFNEIKQYAKGNRDYPSRYDYENEFEEDYEDEYEDEEEYEYEEEYNYF